MQPQTKIKTQCPHCSKSFSVRPDQLGKRAKCGGCGKPFEVVPVVQIEGAMPSPSPLPQPGAAADPYAVGESGESYEAEPQSEWPAASPSAPRAKPRPKPAKRPAPKRIAISILLGLFVAVAVVKFSGVFDPSGPKPQDNSSSAGFQPPAPTAKPSGGNSADGPAPKAGAKPPALAWAPDAAGRRVGTATASIRSDRTQVRVVLPPGTHADASLPCVFVCPAGSNLLTGVNFGEGEQQDFYPLLDRGLAVCFYSLDGAVKDYESVRDIEMAVKMQAYTATGAGLGNLRDAIDTVLAGAPAIDPARLGTMGHSSAGTVAIGGAGADPRIVAVAAMAPILDVQKHLGATLWEQLPATALQAVYKMSPESIRTLTADTLIFIADDDPKSPPATAQHFVEKHQPKATLQRIPTGGHGGAYTSGIGPCVDFLAKKLRATPTPAAGKAAGGEPAATHTPAPAK